MLIPTRIVVEAHRREGFERTDDGSDETLTFVSGEDSTFLILDSIDGEIELAFVVEHIRFAVLSGNKVEMLIRQIVTVCEEEGLSPPP